MDPAGLRPDVPASAIRKLYPRARKHGSAWWLITAYALVGGAGLRYDDLLMDIGTPGLDGIESTRPRSDS